MMPTAAMISSIEVEAKPFASTADSATSRMRARVSALRGLGVEHGALYQEYGFSLEPFPRALRRGTSS